VIDFVPKRRGHFRLESGYHTDLWLDLDGLFADSKRVAPLVDRLAAQLRKYEFDAICGAMVGGAFLAQLLAQKLESQFWFTLQRSGAYFLPEVFERSGVRVVIVDDVMSAGSAMIGTCREVESRGAHVVAAAALLVLGPIGAEFFDKRAIPLETLEREDFNLWNQAECRLCADGVPLEEPLKLSS
jgi:orotate phosphoribosyltransferase